MRSLTTVILLALAATGCTGGADGGGPKHYGSGSHDIESACRDDLDTRYFHIDAESAGGFVMTISWDDSNGDDLDLYLENPDDDDVLDSDDEIPPGDSPAQVQFSVPSAMNLLATVECYDTAEFTGTITVP